MEATKKQLLDWLCDFHNNSGYTDYFGYNQSIESFRKEMSKKKQWELSEIVFDTNEEGQKFIESFESYSHEDFKAMKKDLGIKNNTEIAEIIGLTADSVKNQTAPAKELPAWAKSMIYVWKKFK